MRRELGRGRWIADSFRLIAILAQSATWMSNPVLVRRFCRRRILRNCDHKRVRRLIQALSRAGIPIERDWLDARGRGRSVYYRLRSHRLSEWFHDFISG